LFVIPLLKAQMTISSNNLWGHGLLGPRGYAYAYNTKERTWMNCKLSSQHCMTPGQWTWFLCRVSVVPANELLLQEVNQLIGIELLTSNFLESFSS